MTLTNEKTMKCCGRFLKMFKMRNSCTGCCRTLSFHNRVLFLNIGFFIHFSRCKPTENNDYWRQKGWTRNGKVSLIFEIIFEIIRIRQLDWNRTIIPETDQLLHDVQMNFFYFLLSIAINNVIKMQLNPLGQSFSEFKKEKQKKRCLIAYGNR